MKFFFTIIIVIVVSNCMMSCEGFRCAAGTVIDKNTNKALDSVFCETLTSARSMYTDSTGKFNLCNEMSGCIPKCKDIVIRISKAGYKTITLENPRDSVFYLEK